MISERKLSPLLAACLAALVLSVVPASGDSGYVAPREEIPLTTPLTTGARSLGMGGVAVAVADDATAVTVNPAGLARLQRIEVSAGFSRSSTDATGEMAGSAFESSISHTDLSSLRVAYPFPTFRGSLVIGLSSERVFDFTVDRLAQYEGVVSWIEPGDDEASSGDWKQFEDYLSDGGVYAWSGAVAVDLSPSMAAGVTLSYYTGEYSRAFRWDLEDVNGLSEAYDEVRYVEESTADVTGLGATLGAIYYASDQLSFGLAIDTPVTLTFEGTLSEYTSLEPPDTSRRHLREDPVLFSDEITLPFAVRAGVSYSPTDLLLLGADVSYTDWSELDYAGPLTVTVEDGGTPVRRSLYEESVGYAVGVELLVPSWPLRLRGGYSSRPLAYQGLTIDSDRSCFTLGAGLLIDTVLALDVAWVKGAYDRSDEEYAFAESVADEALVLEATYRF
ncbi:MAG: outer membrane protein transport protein [Candidatus Eisenbacteria bacterium]